MIAKEYPKNTLDSMNILLSIENEISKILRDKVN